MQLLCIRLLESLKSVVLVSGEGRCCHPTWQTTRGYRVKARERVPEKPDVFYNDLLANQPIQPSGTHYKQSIQSCQWPSHLLKVPSANTMALGTKPQHESCWRQTGLKHHQLWNAVFLLVYADLENCSWNSIICFHFYRLSYEHASYNNI